MGEPWKNKQFGNAKYHKQTSNLNSANGKHVLQKTILYKQRPFFLFQPKPKLDFDIEVTEIQTFLIVSSVMSILKFYVASFSNYIIHKLGCPHHPPGGVATTRHRPLTTEGQKRIRKSQKGKIKRRKINKNGTKKAQIRQIQGRRAYPQKEE